MDFLEGKAPRCAVVQEPCGAGYDQIDVGGGGRGATVKALA